MKTVILLLVMSCSIAVLSAHNRVRRQKPGQLENIDVDSLLKNKKYVQTQIKCILNEGKCDKTGRDMKDLLPEVLQRNCRKCSEVQKVNADKIINYMKQNHPSGVDQNFQHLQQNLSY
uniref:Chemosensory protein n=1 Tax=Artemia franciscana TaxID=6661 RepID=Q3LB37_ARTSF|nr:hypothetical protein [Artemia franciscana]